MKNLAFLYQSLGGWCAKPVTLKANEIKACNLKSKRNVPTITCIIVTVFTIWTIFFTDDIYSCIRPM